MAAIALSARPEGDFTALPKGAAEKVVLGNLRGTNEIFGLEMFATVSAWITFGEQKIGMQMLLFLDKIKAAAALIEASFRIWAILAIIYGFWGTPGTALGSMLGRADFVGSKPGGCPQQTRRTAVLENQVALRLWRASGIERSL